MRIISVLGIIGLLTLQYFWLRNAYGMVERDIMEKSRGCLKEALDEEVFERLGKDVSVMSKKDFKPKSNEIIKSIDCKKSPDIILGMQDILIYIGKPHSYKRINSIFQKKITKSIGFLPKYKLRVLDDSIIDKRTISQTKIDLARNLTSKTNSGTLADSSTIYDEICGNTIYLKFSTTKSIELIITSPISSVITKARNIFIFSLLLVLLIGVILIFQFLNMVRDKDFTAFIKDFSRITSHEMRTPVNSIYMLTSRIMSKEYMDEQRIENYHKETLNLCSKLLLAFDNLLLIAKSEQSKILVQKSQVDMRILIEKIADKYRNNYFLNKTLQITTYYDSEDCKAYLDTDLIENTVINLIENAIKYSRETVVISINCCVENKHILLKIKDNGLGIPKSHLKNIFYLFSRGSMKDYKQIKGFGIGLYYVQKVVKAHQGKVSVNSEVGVGSEFIIDIPNRFL